ncbi:MAG: gliding motility-associated protein GldE [Saprospiraceae bacterium]|nr:gliding motility-associated protein GldE [Saprospiraceae bacterium]MBK7810261.1 gliding motility-associated protein GldE [Saprospiraceae bacterium]MBK9629864.1 gliding motility-associated protein GldE [Saprospiraceae bacterium]
MEPSDPYSSNLLIALLGFLYLDFYAIGLILFFIFLVILSGLFSGSEVAYMSLSPTNLESLEEEDSDAARRVIQMRHKVKHFIALILVCNTIVNIGIALLLEHILSSYVPASSYVGISTWIISQFGWVSVEPDQINHIFNFIIAVIGATSIIIFFGEIMPKIYSQIHNVRFAKSMSLPLKVLEFFVSPFTYPLVALSTRVEKHLLERKLGTSSTAREDLDAAIDLAVSDGMNSSNQVEMLKGIIKFNDVSVSQVMTSRTEVCGIDLKAPFEEVLQIVKENGYSRFPIYIEDFDKITGILYAKDLISHLDKGNEFEWQNLIRSNLLYVPETRKIHDLLNDFQVKKLHMSIVVDEYGGTSGIVTLEDIMEEIVGEISDEFDDDGDLNFTRLDANNYVFEGKTLINDMCRVVGVDLSDMDLHRGSADSIAGLILEHTGEMPKKDQELSILNIKLKVLSVSKKRIEKIQITTFQL